VTAAPEFPRGVFAAWVVAAMTLACQARQPAATPPPSADSASPGPMSTDAATPALPDAASADSRPAAGNEAGAGPDLAPDAAVPPPAADIRPVVSASVMGYQLLVKRRNPDGSVVAAPYDIRGISWSPAEKGAAAPGPDAFGRAVTRDLPLMRAAYINTVKTYRPVDAGVLDLCLAHGILAVITVASTASEDYAAAVTALRNHPAVLMWMVGNEWNRNDLFHSCSGPGCYTRVNDIARDIKRLDPNHPVATSFAPTGQLPTDADLQRLDGIDVWGLNVYSPPGFFQRCVDWRVLAQRTGIRKPFFMSEYGTDAYDNRSQRPDEAMQAATLAAQTQEIRNQLSARNGGFACLGGTPFEWSDEWWKFGSPQAQDAGGFANPGVAGDLYANEDWWGIVDIDRKPRQAYTALQKAYAR
jgi:hypothetical protein